MLLTITKKMIELVCAQDKLCPATGIPPELQKLLFKGKFSDGTLVKELGLKEGQKIMLVGCTADEIMRVR